MPGFDLHIHTTASDGTLSGEEVISLAISTGLEGIAITDHDTIEGLDRAIIYARKLSFPVIPGIELSTEYQDKEIHILGYLFDYQLPRVVEKLSRLQSERHGRMIKMVAKLKALGYDVNQEEIFALAGNGSPGRPHLAAVLLKKGYVDSIQSAFQRLIGRGCAAYVPRFKYTPAEAIRLIKNAGGIPVIAHPGLYGCDDLIPCFLKHGLMGVEAFHPDHRAEDEERYLRMAERLNLLVTGGSDFHGTNKEDGRFTLGRKTVTREMTRKLLQSKEKMDPKKGNF